MTVRELIVELGKFDPEAKVQIYSTDDMDWYDVNRVVPLEERSEHQAVTFE